MLAAQKKALDEQLERASKKDDYERMQKNMQLKATLEQLEKSHAQEKQINLNSHFQNVIQYNNNQKEQQTKEMKDIDKYIVEKDISDYDKYLRAQSERKKWQREMMNQELE